MADTTTAAAANSTDNIVNQQPQAMEAGQLNGKEEGLSEADVTSSTAAVGPMDDIDTEEEDDEATVSPGATVVPSNTPVTADSGQGSPNLQSSSESLNEEADAAPDSTTGNAALLPSAEQQALEASAPLVAGQEAGQGEATAAASVPQVKDREAKKLERKEEKKRSKKKEDKGIEFILRALNSLQSPEEKLAALCKKYADLNEEHRTLQTSFKTQQRTVTVVMREKDQLQLEHTRAMMAKSKLESLCRELQKHNKLIKEESIKRAKEDDEKRKEISQQFNNTISEIQTQMSDNTERNTKLRLENENMAAQLKAFINSVELRDQQVDKLQKHHELEKKLFEAKIKQAEAVLGENIEKGNKERELVMLKLAESSKKNVILEAQVSMFKERYAEFEQLHSRSSETFQKYKTEMDKMTKRIKKLEKDGLAWKTKWEKTNKALIEQVDARSKSEKETLTFAQKTRKLESLCRALQAELHNKKPAAAEDDGDGAATNPAPAETSATPPNSPDASFPGQCSPDSPNGDGGSNNDNVTTQPQPSPAPEPTSSPASQEAEVSPSPTSSSSSTTTAVASATTTTTTTETTLSKSATVTENGGATIITGDQPLSPSTVAPSDAESSTSTTSSAGTTLGGDASSVSVSSAGEVSDKSGVVAAEETVGV